MESELTHSQEPVKVSVGVYSDPPTGKHVMIEAVQGGFTMRHFMTPTDARAIGIALCDSANEIELEAAASEGEPFGNVSDESNDDPHMWVQPISPGESDCMVCGRGKYNRIHIPPASFPNPY